MSAIHSSLVTRQALSGKYGQSKNYHSQCHQHERGDLHLRSTLHLPPMLFVRGGARLQLADVRRLYAIDATQPPGFSAEVVLAYFTGTNDATGQLTISNDQ